MSDYLTELSEIAVIELLYAKAEIEFAIDYPSVIRRPSVIRALDHVEYAQRTLRLLAEEVRPDHGE